MEIIPAKLCLSSLSKEIARRGTLLPARLPTDKSPLIHQSLFLELSDEMDTGPTRYDGAASCLVGNEQHSSHSDV